MNHLMLDFETLGTRPDTAVISLGAVLFNSEQVTFNRLWVFDLENQLENSSRSVTAQTIKWWMNQDKNAQNVFNTKETTKLRDFIPQFTEMVAHYKPKVWGNGATFDVSIIENILHQFRHPIPWQFWDHRCYRTMKQMFDKNKTPTFQGTKHDALDDARHQAHCLIEYWKYNPGAEK